jgi:predicted metalloprotease with PDZ domain
VSSYGYGNVEVPAGAPATASSRLIYTAFAAGHFAREPTDWRGGFTALWGAEPPFGARSLMQWTSNLHAWMSKFFQLEVEPFYLVILRANPQNPGGGVAYTNAFVVGYGADTTAQSLKRILAHEMTHTFTTGNETLDKWYAEGIAEYYSAVLPWRAGLISNERFLKEINLTASRYYTDVKKHTPEDQVLDQFWKDTRIRTLPYDRGMMYFAVLDGKIRKDSDGKKSVDDIIQAMVNRGRDHDHKVTVDTWLDLLREYLGEDGPATYRALMAGNLMLPDSDEFGPCFNRVTRKIRRFDMGFDAGKDKIVHDLERGSEAAKAGIRNGDKILSGGASDELQAHVHKTVTLKLQRNDKQLSVTYLPRGKAVDAYQWARVEDVPDSVCQSRFASGSRE